MEPVEDWKRSFTDALTEFGLNDIFVRVFYELKTDEMKSDDMKSDEKTKLFQRARKALLVQIDDVPEAARDYISPDRELNYEMYLLQNI